MNIAFNIGKRQMVHVVVTKTKRPNRDERRNQGDQEKRDMPGL